MERAASRGRRAEGRSVGLALRTPRLSRAALPEILAARRVRVHRRHPPNVRRQVPEDGAPREIQGVPGSIVPGSRFWFWVPGSGSRFWFEVQVLPGLWVRQLALHPSRYFTRFTDAPMARFVSVLSSR